MVCTELRKGKTQRRFVLYVRCTPLSTRPSSARTQPDSWVSAGLRLAPPVLRDLHEAASAIRPQSWVFCPAPKSPTFWGPPSRCEGDREKPESGESSLPRTGDTGTPEPERPPRQRLGRRINLRWTAPPPASPSSPGTLRPAEASFPQGERTARDSGRACWQSGQLGKALIQ